jgi:PAS domain S-box-containing protein
MKGKSSKIQKKIDELLEREEFYKYFLNELNVGFYIIKTKVPIPIDLPEDEQIKMIYEHAYVADCNDILAKMYGFSKAEELIGKRVSELHGGPDVPENIEAHRNFIRSGYKIIGVETLEIDRDGNKKWFRNNTVGIIKNGAIVASIGTQTDITKIKEIEERTKRSEEEKALILNSVAELITFQDRDLRVIWANKSAGNSVNQKPEELIGRHCYEIWHGRESVCENCPVDKAIKTGEFHSNEIRTPDGRVWFIKGYPVKDEKGEVIGAIEVTTEITEKVKLEGRIKEQQKYFEGIFEFSPLAMVITDKYGRIIRINPEFERLFGWKEDEVRGVFLDDIIIEPERKEEAISITNKVAEGGSVIVEGIRLKKDKTPVFVTIIGHPIVVNDEVIAQMGIYRDITEKKRMEEALIESEEKFRILAEKSLVGIYLFQDGIFKYVNPKFEEIFGYSAEELIDRLGPKDLVHPDDLWILEENIRKRLEGEVKDVHYEMRGVRKDKKVIYGEIHGALINYKGKPAIIGTLQDITERKLAEEALKRSEEKYRSLFEESKDGIFISTPEGKIIDLNPAMVEMYGYSSKDELLQTPIENLYMNPKERDEYRKKLEEEGFVKNYEIRGRKKDGTPITLLETSTAVKDESGKVIAYRGIIRDVTAQKKMEEQLIQSVKMEAIGRLAGGIAHDFNNILTVISGSAELLLPKFPPDSVEHKKIKQIIDSSRRAIDLTKQLMTVSKRGISEPVVLNVNEVIKEMEDMLKRLIGEDIKFDLYLNPGLKNVKADRGQIEQVIMNLVVNARDAMPKGGELEIKTENVFLDENYCKIYPGLKEGEYVLISISDTGVGIPPEIMPKIFEPFFTTKKEGSGLGLSTVYWIVKQLGGNVTVYSEVGKGTTFKIYIPVCREEVMKKEKIQEAEEYPEGNEVLLVIEDEKEIIEYIEDVLKPLGYKIISGSSEKEILEKLEKFEGEVHLLLTDVILPDKSGPEIAKTLVPKIPNLKIIFMSGYPEEKLHVSEIIEGKVNFISKPFSPSALARKVREVLDKK